MNPVSFKDTEFANLKQALSQTIPGIFAIIPYWVYLYHSSDLFRLLCNNNSEIAVAIYIVSAILIGAICNELGSWVESAYDSLLSTSDEWNKYLLLKRKKTIIFDVISSVVLRLKFNINMFCSTLVFVFGFNILKFCFIENMLIIGILNLSCIFLLTLFIVNGYYMAKGLHLYRTQLNKSNDKINEMLT